MVSVKKNWVYYMVEGIKNMFGKRTPSNWIEGMSMELKSRRLDWPNVFVYFIFIPGMSYIFFYAVFCLWRLYNG